MKNAKIKILTPVHVGTGRTIDPVCFICEGNAAKRYALEDLLIDIPEKRMTDVYTLSRMVSGVESKRDFYSIFKTGKLPSSKPLYAARWSWSKPLQFLLTHPGKEKNSGSLQIFEQIKALNRPIIPGSSMKGAIECAFQYAFLKSHYRRVQKNLPDFCRYYANRKGGQKKTRDFYFLQLVYGLRSDEADQYSGFLRELFSCLSVRDISFNDLEILKVTRFHADNERNDQSKNIGIGFAEYIPAGLEKTDVYPFEIIEMKADRLRDIYQKDWIAKELIESFCSVEKLQKAIQTYTYDVMKADDHDLIQELYDREGVAVYDHLLKQIDFCNEKNHRVILRIGKNTSYYFKTVSWLIVQNDFYLFEKYFKDIFAPVKVKKNKYGIEYPDPEFFPITVPLAQSQHETWPGGFICIEYAD